jgi:hypothetical protein
MNQFSSMFSQVLQIFPKSEFYSALHASVIDLCASLFDRATFGQTKGAVRLHLPLDHDGYLPVFAHITEGELSRYSCQVTIRQPRSKACTFMATLLRGIVASIARENSSLSIGSTRVPAKAPINIMLARIGAPSFTASSVAGRNQCLRLNLFSQASI